MKPKTKTPWARYITIGLFILVFVTIIVQQFSRPQAAESSNMKLEFNKAQESVRTFDSNASWRHVTQDENEANQEFPCSEPSLGCVVNGMTKRQLDWWKNELSGSATQSGSTSKTSDAGVLGQVGNLISLNYTPQASGVYYLADTMGSMGLATPTYAQGYGFYALSPFLRLWRVFRNVVYMIFAIMIIVIAVLILFRQKVGSQAAVTAQQAIPRIVVALILVTFSYAIAGFMIDVMYWCMYAISRFITVEAGTLKGSNTKVTKAMLLGGSFADLAGIVLSGQYDNIYSGVNSMVEGLFKKGFWQDAIGFVTGTVISIIFIIALLFSLFRLLFILMKAYASVLLYTIFSPFFLMLYAIPGTNSFNNWIKKLAANLAPSIIVFVMLIMTGVMNQYTSGSAANAGGFVPPYITANGGSGATLKSVGSIVCFAILLAMPEIVNGIQQKLGGGPGFFEQMAGAAGGRFMRYGGGMAWGYLSGGMMGMGRGALRQGAGLASMVAVGGSDYLRRRGKARKEVDSTMGTKEDFEAKTAKDLDLASLRDAQQSAINREASFEGEGGDTIRASINEAAGTMDKDVLKRELEASGIKYEETSNDDNLRSLYIEEEFKRQRQEAADKAKTAREEYEKAQETYRTKVATYDAQRQAKIKSIMESSGRGSFNHWRRVGARQGFWGAAREAWGLTDWQTDWDAWDQAVIQRQRLDQQNALRTRLNLKNIKQEDVTNTDMRMQSFQNAANARGSNG